jgi:phage-related protein
VASNKELRALITIAGKIDPSLQAAMTKASGQTAKTSSKFTKLGGIAVKSMKAIGTAAIAGAAVGAAALSTLAVKASEAADNIIKMRHKTGLTAEELQRLQYVSGQLGANFEAIPTAVSAMTKQMFAATKGSKEAQRAFKTLGITIKDTATGKMKPQSQVFKETLLQLSKIKDESYRNGLAFQLFGKGASDLFPILNAGSGEIERLASEADRLGIVLGSDKVEALDNFGDTLDKVIMAAKGIGNQAVGAFIPKLLPLLDKLALKMPKLAPMAADMAGGMIDGFIKLLPLLSKIGEKAFPILSDAVSIVSSAIQPLLPVIGELVMSLLPPLGDIVTLIGRVMKPLVPVIATIARVLGAVLVGALQVAMPLLEGLATLLTFILDSLNWVFEKLGKLKIGTPTMVGSGITGGMGIDKNAGQALNIKKKFAYGGIATKPSITGEGPYDEMNIPLVKSQRSFGLLDQTAKALGVSVGGSGLSIDYHPTIIGANRSEIEPVLQQHKSELRQMVEDIFEEKARVSYA